MLRSCLLLTLLLSLCCCSSSSDDPPMAAPPTIFLATSEIGEGSQNTSIAFELSAVPEQAVEFFYTIEGQSAIVGEDLEASSGSVTFAPGETTKSVQVSVLADDILEFDEKFVVKITNIVNATMFNNEVAIKIIDDDGYQAIEDADGFITPDAYPSMELVWSDEFNDTQLNIENWTHQLGNGCPDLCGWGNGELQLYSEDNTELRDGKMVITAKNPMGNIYSSSRLNTKGKQEFKYGRIDIRAKLPYGRGIWPALWMLGTSIDEEPWPVSGEIDIAELVGHQAGTVHGTAHYDRDGHQQRGTGWPLNAPEKYADKYHVFTILWQEGQIEWFVDYNKYFTLKDDEVGFNNPFNEPFFFLANIAVGGQWPGDPDDTTPFPQTMEIDYIRVFQTAGLD